MNSRKTIAITGGGSGLGKALSLLYAARGWNIALTDISEPRLGAVANEILMAGAEVYAGQCDVRCDDPVREWVNGAAERFGRIDVFVNNAGVAGAGSLEQTSFEDWAWMLDINLMGVVRGCKAVAPLMRRQGFGHIVNVASLAGIASAPMMASYNVAKAGVVSLSESLRADLSGTGVGVSVVCPSFFVSDLASSARTSNAEQHRIVSKLVNKARYSADDVARIVADDVAAGKFMILPQSDARFAWWFKRLTPERFHHWVVKRSRGMVASENTQRAQHG
ncbi:MAG: SDR family oxidoreductase [Betaproteobacteria bacterium]|nr:SDR family oxidoreductase [Betaproteobacteria bacterium]